MSDIAEITATQSDEYNFVELTEKPNGFLTTNELAESLGVSLQYIYKLIKQNKIGSYLTTNKRRIIPSSGVRKIFESRGYTYPKTNLSFQIVKGGVGKTSMTFSLALRASHYGAKVLAIDMDQQGNLTRSFNKLTRESLVWIDIYKGQLPIENSVTKVNDFLDLIPSNLNNSRLDTELTQSSSNLRDLINDRLEPIRKNYDIVIIDCPPAINKINTAVTCASDLVIIPINPEPYSMDGLEYTLSELKRIKSEYKLNKLDYKLLWNRYDAREKLGAIYLHQIAKNEELINKLLPIVVNTDVSIKNSIFDEKSIFDLPKATSIKKDISNLTQELLGISDFFREDNRG